MLSIYTLEAKKLWRMFPEENIYEPVIKAYIL